MRDFNEIRSERAQGSLLGLACGDALGTTLEFKSKDTYQPLTNIVGGGPFRLKAGQWTDDTSMMLCVADSLIEKGKLDLADQAERYMRWYQHGDNSCTGRCFDIGNTVRAALGQYQRTGNPESGSTAENTAGNGSLMRIAPIALFYADAPVEVAMKAAAQSSRVTHAEQRCVEACELMTLLLHRALNTADLTGTSFFLKSGLAAYLTYQPNCHDDIRAICDGEFIGKSRDEIHGTGFVIQSLEAALWCFYKSSSFEEGALLAANLGEDADTTAAVYGQLAGAFYGANAIPKSWRDILAWQQHIHDTASWLLDRPDNELVQDFVQLIQQQIKSLPCHDVPLYKASYQYGLMVSNINYEAPFERCPSEPLRFFSLRDFAHWLTSATFRDCVSYLIRLVRSERFCEGAIEDSINNGFVALLLDRLAALVSCSAVSNTPSGTVAPDVMPLAAILTLIEQGELSITGSIQQLEAFGKFLQGKAIELMPMPELGQCYYVAHPLQDYEAESADGEEPHSHLFADEVRLPDIMRMGANWHSSTRFCLTKAWPALFTLELAEGIKLTTKVINAQGEQQLTIYQKDGVKPGQVSRSFQSMLNAWCKSTVFVHEPLYIRAVKQLGWQQPVSELQCMTDELPPGEPGYFGGWRGYLLGIQSDASGIQVLEHKTHWTGPHSSIMETAAVKSFPPDADKSTVFKFLSNWAKRKNPMVICRHCGQLIWADWHVGQGLCESCDCAITGKVY